MLLLQYLLPQKLLTRFMARLTRWRMGWLTTAFIRWFVRRYQVDMSQALEPNPAAYASFNDFFTRPLKEGARPLQSQGEQELVSPVDGAISALGALQDGCLLQAKGHQYSLDALLAGNKAWCDIFHGGHFLTAYLSPKDYHRIHMPIDGRLLSMTYVPGRLFSVNQQAVAGIPGLFSRNERTVCLFETAFGRLAVILVGAMIVGNMETVWHGEINPDHSAQCASWDYGDQSICLQRGQELGRFNMGSTVILLTESSDFGWSQPLKSNDVLQMGQLIGRFGLLEPPYAVVSK